MVENDDELAEALCAAWDGFLKRSQGGKNVES